eukprot:6079608-Prymnesium_polylepis.3
MASCSVVCTNEEQDVVGAMSVATIASAGSRGSATAEAVPGCIQMCVSFEFPRSKNVLVAVIFTVTHTVAGADGSENAKRRKPGVSISSAVCQNTAPQSPPTRTAHAWSADAQGSIISSRAACIVNVW